MIAWPLVATLLFWWGSTALILYLATRGGMGRRAMWPASVLGAFALAGLIGTRDETTALAAYCSFSCGLVLWGWIELSYLTGMLTGPRRAQVECPEGASEGERFLRGIGTSLYHELAVMTAGLALLWACRDAANAVGAWTFAILWVMRWSAKLNLFLGVPNLNAEFFPPHLRYLESYIRRRPLNLLFPISVTAGTIPAVLLIDRSFGNVTPFAAVADLSLGVLLALAVLEHWFMVVPMRDADLWRWALPKRREREHVRSAPVTEGVLPMP
ncbi:MAG: putative photosynthetic complex assembly protein PuhE [Pseudomonadales bacterium]|nr:putative photosynthetic complex assembly protein PuhE [Pseudomonadales bacterium]